MKFNTKTRYGLRTMIELALNNENKNSGIFQKDISEKQGISLKYLDQIIAALKAAGLLVNVAGKKSGYRISKDPEKISIYDIYKAFEHDLYIIDCLNKDSKCDREDYCAAKEFWNNLNKHIIKYMDSIKLKELSDKQAEIKIEEDNMYYI